MHPTSEQESPRARRLVPVTLLAATLGAVAAACAGSSEWGPAPDRITLPTLDAPVDLPVERCGGYYIVQASVNGQRPVPLLLDTGAGSTHLDPTVVREWGLRGGVDSLAIGEFTAYRFGYRELDMTQLSNALGRRVEGILGHPVFSGLLQTWDLPEGRIQLEADTLPAEGPGIVPARRDRRPFVGSILGSDTLWVLIDTGSSRGLTVRNPERHRLSSPMAVTGARVRVDGVHLVESGRLEGEARIGPIRLTDPVLNNSVSVDLVGQEVLRHFRITFDPRTDRVRFERPGAPLDEPLESPPVSMEGFALVPESEWARVGWTDPVAEEAGLRRGDRVVAIDGERWATRGCRSPDPEPIPDSIRLTVLREGTELEVTVPVRAAHSGS